MTSFSNPNNPFTPFLPSTYDTPSEKDRLDVFLVEKLAGFADVINDKKIGAYTQEAENLNGEKWIFLTTKKVRSGYQIIAYIPSFINQTVRIPIENINQQLIITHTWGSASLPCTSLGAGDGDYFSFMPMGDTRISYTLTDIAVVNPTDFPGFEIIITTDAGRAAYSGFVVIEFLHDGI
jgi:hypothetical protein